MDAGKQIERLLAFGIQNQLIEAEDVHFVRNQLLALLQEEVPFTGEVDVPQAPEEVVPHLIQVAVDKGLLVEDTLTHRDLWDAKIMGHLIARPSAINDKFSRLANDSVQAATDYFYKLAKDSNYIRMDRIRNNMAWKSATKFGDLEITINLSKPEKDPREIAAERNAPKSNYPACLLCSANVGYAGRVNHPARQNLRVIPLQLNNEPWYFQYSPYVYYNEHCIILHQSHIPMKITANTFARLLDFVRQFPHYFIGSNADLPIVGGSILNHDHFQGGSHTFAMMTAEKKQFFKHPAFTDVEIAVVNWPLSVLRLTSETSDLLLALSSQILDAWRAYSDEACDILAYTGEGDERTPHNTITPVSFRDEQGRFVLDLVLRNNRTTEDRPFGLFHPEERLHHLKKENIGLIEVMGLAVLPGRLASELEEIVQVLHGDRDLNPIAGDTAHPLNKHYAWLQDLLVAVPKGLSVEEITANVRDQVTDKFSEVLAACGVFKQDEKGELGWQRFLAHCGMQNY